MIFKYVRRVDAWLLVLNFAALLLIAVLPWPTAVLGHNQFEPAAAVLYATTIALTGATSAAIWLYATRHRRLVDRDLPHAIVRRRFLLSVSSPVVFLLSIPLALWRPAVAELAWGVIWVLFFVVVRRYIDCLAKP